MTKLEPTTIDLAIAAQSFHWFDLARFRVELKRVLKPKGVFAHWSYSLQFIRAESSIENILKQFYWNLQPYWPPKWQLVQSRSLAQLLPMTEIPAPKFDLVTNWSLIDLRNFLATLSSVRQYQQVNRIDPLLDVIHQLKSIWTDETVRKEIVWSLVIQVGKLID